MEPGEDRLRRWEVVGLVLIGAILLAHGVVAEVRSAFLENRHTDAGCYFRAGWAARTGGDIYSVVCDNCWHYAYPPFFAVLMTPLADPVRGENRTGYLPYAASCAILYLVNLAALFATAHLFATVFERTSSDPRFRHRRSFGRRWWALRVAPLVALIIPAGVTLGRGQINFIVLALVGVALQFVLERKHAWAGAFFAAAAAVKVIPVYLFAYPAGKLDRRTLAGIAAGLFMTLGVVPLAYFGSERCKTQYSAFFHEVIGPGAGLPIETRGVRDGELLGATATDHIGIVHAVHNLINLGVKPTPQRHHPIARIVRLASGVLLTLLVVWPLGRKTSVASQFGAISLLLALMPLLSPVSHLHYSVYFWPLIVILLGRRWERLGRVTLTWTMASLGAWLFLTALAPQFSLLARYLCLPLYGLLPLLAVGLRQHRAQLRLEERVKALSNSRSDLRRAA